MSLRERTAPYYPVGWQFSQLIIAMFVGPPDAQHRESPMMRTLVLGAATFALSAASASADGYGHRHHYGYHYGYGPPVFEQSGNAYYGYPAPSYIHSPWPIYAAVPIYAAPVVSVPASGYAPGYGRGYWGGYGYGYGWR
jgi:hypothetical protein